MGFQGGIVGAVLAVLALALGQQASSSRAPGHAAVDTARASSARQAQPPANASSAILPPNVSMTDGSVLDVTQPAPGDNAEMLVFVANSDKSPVTVRFYLTLRDSASGRDGSFELLPAAETIPPLEVKALPLRVRPRGTGAAGVEKGFLTMVADDNGAATHTVRLRPIRLAPAAEAPPLMTGLLMAGFLLGLLAVLFAWPWKNPPSAAAPLPWNRESWASNLTVVGSALVAFSGLAAPTALFHHMTRAQYGSLAALLSGIVLLASAIYAFLAVETRSPLTVRLPLAFVLVVTLGAAFSQLATLGMLVREAYEALVLPYSIYIATDFIVVGAVVALFIYACRTIHGMTGDVVDEAARAHAERTLKAAMTERTTARIDRWHLP
ncbi:MAG TPA: hypothetical protein VF746_03345 [Longimicrobium sp.]|jgi:hypothetical protein